VLPSSPAPGSPTPAATHEPFATPTAPTPAAWFEDTFDAALGWVAADATLLQGALVDGAFVLRPHPSAEPAYVWAPEDGAIGSALAVEADVMFPATGRALAGLALADLDFGLRLVLLVSSSGEWRLQRDDALALRTLAGGRAITGEPGTPVQLRLVLRDGTAIARIGNHDVGRAEVTIDVGHAGLAAQAPAGGERVVIDDFRVTLLP
jgi:hypothetical protein